LDKASKEQDEAKQGTIKEEVKQLSRQIERCRKRSYPTQIHLSGYDRVEASASYHAQQGKGFLHDGEARSVFSNILGKHEQDGETGEGVLLKGFQAILYVRTESEETRCG